MKKILLAAALLFFASSVRAEDFSYTVSWTPGDNLADGFRLYWGTGGGLYQESFDMGMGTGSIVGRAYGPKTFSFDILTMKRVCFVATAYNEAGESGYSNEVCKDLVDATPVPTATKTPTMTPTRTPTRTPTKTPTATPTQSVTLPRKPVGLSVKTLP